jgi:hypothetical protein
VGVVSAGHTLNRRTQCPPNQVAPEVGLFLLLGDPSLREIRCILSKVLRLLSQWLPQQPHTQPDSAHTDTDTDGGSSSNSRSDDNNNASDSEKFSGDHHCVSNLASVHMDDTQNAFYELPVECSDPAVVAELALSMLIDLEDAVKVRRDVARAVRLVRVLEHVRGKFTDLFEPADGADADNHKRKRSDSATTTTSLSAIDYDSLRAEAMKLHLEWKRSLTVGSFVNILPTAQKGRQSDNSWYRAKIVDMQQVQVSNGTNGSSGSALTQTLAKIHFQKWPAKYDVEVDIDAADTVILPDESVLYELKSTKESAADSIKSSGLSCIVPAEHANVADAEQPMLSKSGRVIKLKNTNLSINPTKKTATETPTKRKTTTKKRHYEDYTGEEEQDLNDWICSVCMCLESSTGSKLLLCDGPCLRSFHVDCLSEKVNMFV